MIQGLKNRFSGKSRFILEAYFVIISDTFTEFPKKYPTAAHLQVEIERFCALYGIDSYKCALYGIDSYKCALYGIDSYKCANELFSFAKVFQKFNTDNVKSTNDGDGDDDDEDFLTDTDDNGKPSYFSGLSGDFISSKVQFDRCFSHSLQSLLDSCGDASHVS